jgi:hypothetical protein
MLPPISQTDRASRNHEFLYPPCAVRIIVGVAVAKAPMERIAPIETCDRRGWDAKGNLAE